MSDNKPHPLISIAVIYGTIGFLSWSPSLKTFIIILLVWLSYVWGCHFHEKYLLYRAKRVKCRHGITGGQAQRLCDICEKERIAAEVAAQQRYRAEKEANEREQALKKGAEALLRKEAKRLTASMVPNIQELRNLSSQRFEDIIAQMFRRLGYEVKQTPYTNDSGRDAILLKNGKKFLVECKKYSEDNLSGRPDLQKFHSALISDKAAKGFFITTGGFTKQAVEFASRAEIELIDPISLGKMMYESTLTASSNDSYQAMCSICGNIVEHSLRTPQIQTCKKGHIVEPTLTIEDIFEDFGNLTPKCIKCGTRMRIVQGRRGSFWGCSKYPKCKSVQTIRHE